MLALQGKGVTEIARIVGCNHSHICRLLAPNIKQIEGYLAFKADPAALWEYQEYKVLSSVTPENINKARLAEKATFSGIARDKVRLQRGLSTSNINAITSIIQAVHERKIQPATALSPEVLPYQVSYLFHALKSGGVGGNRWLIVLSSPCMIRQ